MIALFRKTRERRSSESVAKPAACRCGSGTIQLRDATVFADRESEICRTFLARVFEVKEVSRVQIDASRCAAEIEFQENGGRSAAVLTRLAAALRCTSRRRDGAAGHLHLGGDRPGTLRVYRHGTTVSTWEVVHELPGRVRLRHEQLYGRRRAARYLEQELETVFGVLQSKARTGTGTVLIHFDERAINTGQLLQIVEGMLGDFCNPRQRGYAHPDAGGATTNSALVLATIGEFAVPALLPASAALLVLSNVDTLGSAVRELRDRRLGLSVLYISIVAATLATGGFLTAALMGWFIRYWDRRSHHQLSQVQRQLLADFRRESRFAWLCQGDVEVGVAVEQLQPGDTIVVRTGELIPADGVVTAGEAEVDQRLLRGVPRMTPLVPGDEVYARSLVFQGCIQVTVGRSGQQTRVAAIVQAIEDASTPPPQPLKIRGRRFADKAVAPTLATAGLGLAVGDLTTALAILRPDYWSGPGMSGPLGNLHDVVACAHRGVVVRDPAAFQRFAESEILLIDLRCAVDGYQATGNRADDGRTRALHQMARGVRQLQRSHSARVGLISEGSQSDVARCADFLGVDFFESGLSANAKTELVRDRAERGERVTFVGDCRTHKPAVQHAHLAISTGDIAHLADDPAHVFLLDSQLAKLTQLGDVARSQRRRQRVHESCTVLPNLVCVAGAFVLGFTSLHTVLITNLGVYTVYRSGTKWLQRLQNPGPTHSNDLVGEHLPPMPFPNLNSH